VYLCTDLLFDCDLCRRLARRLPGQASFRSARARRWRTEPNEQVGRRQQATVDGGRSNNSLPMLRAVNEVPLLSLESRRLVTIRCSALQTLATTSHRSDSATTDSATRFAVASLNAFTNASLYAFSYSASSTARRSGWTVRYSLNLSKVKISVVFVIISWANCVRFASVS